MHVAVTPQIFLVHHGRRVLVTPLHCGKAVRRYYPSVADKHGAARSVARRLCDAAVMARERRLGVICIKLRLICLFVTPSEIILSTVMQLFGYTSTSCNLFRDGSDKTCVTTFLCNHAPPRLEAHVSTTDEKYELFTTPRRID